jgi:hypothetical protein
MLKPKRHDEGVPHLGGEAAEAGGRGKTARSTAAELVGLHGDLDAGRATL